MGVLSSFREAVIEAIISGTVCVPTLTGAVMCGLIDSDYAGQQHTIVKRIIKSLKLIGI